MDGADKRAWHLYEGMVAAGAAGMFIGRGVTVHEGCPPVHHSPLRTWRDRKKVAALVALATGQDYWELKMLRPATWRAVKQASQQAYDAVLVNFLYSLPLAQAFVARRIPLIVDTHNYDPAWFGTMARASRNPVLRWLCHRAIRNSEKTLSRLPTGTILVHVSENDAQRYRLHRPDLQHVVVENGTTVHPRRHQPDYTKPGKR